MAAAYSRWAMPDSLSIRLRLPRARPGSARTRGDLRTFALLLRYRKLHVVFQPLADLRSGTVFGHEALIRDELASGRLVAPFATRVALARRLSIATVGTPRRRDAVARVVALLKAQR